MNIKANKRVFRENIRSLKTIILVEGRKTAAVNILIAKILVYSAIKINAKGPLLYSVLNPETNSDSPSAISKGVRFVSASIVTSQIKNIGKIIIKFSGSHKKDMWNIE
jgi:hypothetical protein